MATGIDRERLMQCMFDNEIFACYLVCLMFVKFSLKRSSYLTIAIPLVNFIKFARILVEECLMLTTLTSFLEKSK